jgi:hypothetical protein
VICAPKSLIGDAVSLRAAQCRVLHIADRGVLRRVNERKIFAEALEVHVEIHDGQLRLERSIESGRGPCRSLDKRSVPEVWRLDNAEAKVWPARVRGMMLVAKRVRWFALEGVFWR